MKKVKFITCEGGDWEVLKIDDKIHYENHNIPSYIWLKLLKDNYEVEEIELNDEDMEMGNY